MRNVWLVAGLGLLTSCGGTTAPDASLSITFTSDAPVVSAQQPVALHIRLVNESSAPVSVHTACGPHFDVFNAGGVRVGPPQRFCTPTIYTPRQLESEDSLVIEDTWAGNGAADNSQVGTPLPAGSYRLVARIKARVAQRDRIYLSAPITVQVAAP